MNQIISSEPLPTDSDSNVKVKEAIKAAVAAFQTLDLNTGEYMITLQCLCAGALSVENRALEKRWIALLEKEIKRLRRIHLQNGGPHGAQKQG